MTMVKTSAERTEDPVTPDIANKDSDEERNSSNRVQHEIRPWHNWPRAINRKKAGEPGIIDWSSPTMWLGNLQAWCKRHGLKHFKW